MPKKASIKESPYVDVPITTRPNSRESTTMGILGTPIESRNQGVQALAAALTRLCLGAANVGTVEFYGSHRTGGTARIRPDGAERFFRIIPWRLSPKGKLSQHLLIIVFGSLLFRYLPIRSIKTLVLAKNDWIASAKRAAVIGDIRGGDSFSDIYGLKRFLIATLPVASVIWVKGSIVQFPQTYGPYKSWISRVVARWILRHSRVIVARDKQSQAVAQELVGPGQEVLLSPDVAFALYAERPESLEIDGVAGQAMPANAIGLNVNGLMYNGGYTKRNMFGLKLDYPTFLAKLVPALLRAHDGPILLVPHTYAPAGDVESDNEACHKLKDSLPEDLRARVQVLTGEYDCHQLKGVIGQCTFFVGSRMHSCIAALSQGVPCVGVAYSMKFRGVFETVGAEDCVLDGRHLNDDACVEEIKKHYATRAHRRLDLEARLPVVRKQLADQFGTLFTSP